LYQLIGGKNIVLLMTK